MMAVKLKTEGRPCDLSFANIGHLVHKGDMRCIWVNKTDL